MDDKWYLIPYKTTKFRYSPDEIKEIRKFLGESRAVFGKRFLVSDNAIKKWENGTNSPCGPALILLKFYKQEALSKRKEQNEILAISLTGGR